MKDHRLALALQSRVTKECPHLLEAPLAVVVARLSPARHSADFRSVRWFGRSYTFTAGQAVIVRQLWQAWENGTPVVGKAVLLETADLRGESVKDVFRSGAGKAAWGDLIKFDGEGNYWLAEPPTEPQKKASKVSGLSKQALAIAYLFDHPSWSNEQIAEAASCHPNSLYRMKKFMTATEALRGGKSDYPGVREVGDGTEQHWQTE